MAGTIRKYTWTTRKGEKRQAWQADYYDQHGQRHKHQSPTKKEAAAWLLQASVEVRDGTHTPDRNSVTVAEAGELWLRRAEANGLERGTQRTYDQLVRLCINPLLGNVKLSRLTRARVETFRDDLLIRFAYLRARQALSALRSIIGHAQGRGLVAKNDAREVRIAERRRLQESLIVGRSIPTSAEVRALIAAADGWRKVIVTVAAFTGLREAELRGLYWADVDFTSERITVCQRADQWGEIGPPKSKAGQRTIDMAPLVASELRRWKLACGHPVMVFPGPSRKKPLSQSTITEAFAALHVVAGISGEAKYTFHALRHFFASQMIALRHTSKWLQVVMGHENITLTLGTYGHLFPDTGDARARMAQLEAAVFGPT